MLYLNGLSTIGEVHLLDSTDNILSISLSLTGQGAKRWFSDEDRATSGLYVQLWIPRIHPLSSHPFSVAAIERITEGEVRLQLYVQARKGITARLLQKTAENGGSCNLHMMVEGFYGKSVQTQLSHSKVCIAGGIGITGMIAHLQNAMSHNIEVHLVWLVSNPEMIAIAVEVLRKVDYLAAFGEESKESPCRQSLSIYVTRPVQRTPYLKKNISTEMLATANEEEAQNEKGSHDQFQDQLHNLHLPLNVKIHCLGSRPDLIEVVLPFITPKKTVLFCCGPAELLDSARSISRQHDIDYHEEAFAW